MDYSEHDTMRALLELHGGIQSDVNTTRRKGKRGRKKKR